MSERTSRISRAIARLVQSLTRIAFCDGVVPGVARLSILATYGTSLAGALRCLKDVPEAMYVFALLAGFATVLAVVIGWKSCAMAFLAPDWPLWHNEHGVSWYARLGCAAGFSYLSYYALALASALTVPHGGLVALIPLAASPLEHVRLACMRRPTCRA